MVMLHPGQQAPVGAGPRLLVELPASHATTAALAVDPPGGLSVTKHPRGRWIVNGAPGASGRLAVVSSTGGPMADALTVRLSLPGGAPDAPRWELGDVHVDGRARVEVLSVEVDPGGTWLVRSLVRSAVGTGGTRRPTAPPGSGAVVSDPPGSAPSAPVVVGDPVTVDVVVAVDRSASMQWTFEGPGLTEVILGLMTARSRALTPESTLRWLTCGSSSADGDGPREVDAHDRTAEEIARALRPELPSSGSRADSVLPGMAPGSLLVSVTDRWPEAELIGACRARGIGLAAVLLGIPADPVGWPAEWRIHARRCADQGVAVLPVGSGAGALGSVRDWGMRRLAEIPGPDPVEVR